MRGGEEEQNEEGLETSGGEDEEKEEEEERSQGCRQVLRLSPEMANSVAPLEERAHVHMWMHLQPPADKKKRLKCVFWEMDPLFFC